MKEYDIYFENDAVRFIMLKKVIVCSVYFLHSFIYLFIFYFLFFIFFLFFVIHVYIKLTAKKKKSCLIDMNFFLSIFGFIIC